MAVYTDNCRAKAFNGTNREWKQCSRRHAPGSEFCARHKTEEQRKHGIWSAEPAAEGDAVVAGGLVAGEPIAGGDNAVPQRDDVVADGENVVAGEWRHLSQPHGSPISYGPDFPPLGEWRPPILLAILDDPNAVEPPPKKRKVSGGKAVLGATAKTKPKPLAPKAQLAPKAKARRPAGVRGKAKCATTKPPPSALSATQQAVVANAKKLKPSQELVLGDYVDFCKLNADDWLSSQCDVGEKIDTPNGDIWISDLAFYAFFVQAAEAKYTHLTLHSKFRDLKKAIWSLELSAAKVPGWINFKADAPPLMSAFFRTSKAAAAHSEDPAKEKAFLLTEHGQRWILHLIVKHMQGTCSPTEIRDGLFLWVAMGRSHRIGFRVR